MTNIIDGRPISEAPRDGTVILVETMRYSGVPATGGYRFERMEPSSLGRSWCPVGQKGIHYGESSILRWWPDGTDPATLTPTPRTNWSFIPSNGSHGEAIYDSWCRTCVHERAIREDHENAIRQGLGCDILARTMAFGIGDAEYPTEWTYDRKTGEPKCTARVEDKGQPPPEARCDKTIDMFEGGTDAAKG